MSIEIQYTNDKLGVYFCAVGEVTGKDIIEKEKEIFQSKEFINLKYWLVDRTRCATYEVSSQEVKLIAQLDNEAARINPNLLMVLVSETDLQQGMSRMYQAYVDEAGFKTIALRDRESAEKWIQDELNKTE